MKFFGLIKHLRFEHGEKKNLNLTLQLSHQSEHFNLSHKDKNADIAGGKYNNRTTEFCSKVHGNPFNTCWDI